MSRTRALPSPRLTLRALTVRVLITAAMVVAMSVALGPQGGAAKAASTRTTEKPAGGLLDVPPELVTVGVMPRVVPATGRRRTVGVTAVTVNIPYTISGDRARAQLRRVLSHTPDVVMLQEVRERPLRRWIRRMPGRWGVVQASGAASRRASAIIYDARRFQIRQRGLTRGFDGRRYDRWIVWAVFRSPRTELAVAGLHLPPDPHANAVAQRSYRQMARHTRRLARTLRRAGYPVVLGGDWNRPLDRPLERWEPVRSLRRAGLTTNWLHGQPCRASTVRGGRIDGFGYNGGRVAVMRQGCLRAGSSDHRPVWARLRVT